MKYFLKRTLKLIPILFGLTILSFSLLYLAPSDPAEMYYHNLGASATEEMLDNFREEKGLNEPFLNQYMNWVERLVQGDLGESYADGQNVIEKINRAIPYTLSLSLNALILSLFISFPLGFYLALKPNSKFRKFILAMSFIGNSLPSFIIGLGLMYLLSIRLGWFPVLAENSIKGIVLPTLAISIAMASRFVRQIGTIVEEELRQDHIKGLRVRGVPIRKILFYTVLKNSAVNILTLVGMSFGTLLGGTAVIETMFNWPGLGKLIVDGVTNRDFPLVQGVVLWMGVTFVLINIATDLSYALFDPRIRIGGERK